MLPRAAAAVVENLVAAVVVTNVLEALRDFGDRGVPVDFLVAAVGGSAHRGRQPVGVVLVVVEPQRLVAGEALRRWGVLVAADLGETATGAVHTDGAGAIAQEARCRFPVSGHRRPFGPGIRPAAVHAAGDEPGRGVSDRENCGQR